MSGGGSSGGGGGGVSITKQLFSPRETAARNTVFNEADTALAAQKIAISGGGSAAIPAQEAQFAPIIPEHFVGGGSGGGTRADFGPGGGGGGQGRLVPQSGGQQISPATPFIPAVPGGVSNTPQGNVNPASQPVPFNPLTGLSQAQLLEFALGQGQTGVNDVQSALSYGLNEARDPFSNPALQDLLESTNRRLFQQFTDPGGALSQIRDQSLQAGQFGGTRQGIGEGIAAGRFAEVLGDTSAQLINNAYNVGQETFGRSLALAPQSLGLGSLPATYTGAVGAQLENKAQQFEDYAATGRAFDLNAPFIPVQNFANIVNGTISPGLLSTGSANPSSSSSGIGGIISGGLGGGLAGGALAGMSGGAVGGPVGMAAGAALGILGSLL